MTFYAGQQLKFVRGWQFLTWLLIKLRFFFSVLLNVSIALWLWLSHILLFNWLQSLNSKYGCNVPLLLMNSVKTDDDTVKVSIPCHSVMESFPSDIRRDYSLQLVYFRFWRNIPCPTLWCWNHLKDRQVRMNCMSSLYFCIFFSTLYMHLNPFAFRNLVRLVSSFGLKWSSLAILSAVFSFQMRCNLIDFDILLLKTNSRRPSTTEDGCRIFVHL